MSEPSLPGPLAATVGAGARYAVYFSPAPDSPWAQFGRLWLDGVWRPPEMGNAAWQAMLQEPRRYGFHATLKAPFRLAVGTTAEALVQRLDQLATRLRCVPLGPVQVQSMEGYVALMPTSPPPALQALAERCVLDLDDLRAPLTPEDWARRRPHRLDDRGRELLQAHGYPHVLERFRFHLTLASVRNAAQSEAVIDRVREPLLSLQQHQGLTLDRLCVFVERGPGWAFERLCDFELRAVQG